MRRGRGGVCAAGSVLAFKHRFVNINADTQPIRQVKGTWLVKAVGFLGHGTRDFVRCGFVSAFREW